MSQDGTIDHADRRASAIRCGGAPHGADAVGADSRHAWAGEGTPAPMGRPGHGPSRHPPLRRAWQPEPVLSPERVYAGWRTVDHHDADRPRHDRSEDPRHREGAGGTRQPGDGRQEDGTRATSSRRARFSRIDLETRVTTEIGKLPAGASIATVNADETLMAGTITEGTLPDRPATGGRDSYPGKGEMMERRLAARLPMQLFTMSVKSGEIERSIAAPIGSTTCSSRRPTRRS